jgi:hypothetical protein
MATFSPMFCTGSTSGRVVPVGAAVSPGTLVHTAADGDRAVDEVFLWVANVGTVSARLTIEWGGLTDPGDHLVHDLVIPAKSPLIPVVTGQRLNGGLEIRAFANIANVLNVSGFVNRIE